MAYNLGGMLRPTLQTGGYSPQAQPTPYYPNHGTGPILGPANGSGSPSPVGPLQAPTPYAGPQPTQAPLPTPGRRPSDTPYFGKVDKVLQDSNPVSPYMYQASRINPVGSTTSQTAGQQYNPFPSISGAPQSQQNVGGSVLGSSTSQPSWYGGGLAPASGLGGGLYPSLVSLYGGG